MPGMIQRIIISIILLLGSICAMAGNIKYPGDKTYIFRFSLNDKTPTDYSLDKPWQFLSKKSIERRRRQGIAIDSTDLPVCSKYIMEIESHDVDIIGTSRWQNTVLVRSSDSLLLEQLARLHFVKHHKCGRHYDMHTKPKKAFTHSV